MIPLLLQLKGSVGKSMSALDSSIPMVWARTQKLLLGPPAQDREMIPLLLQLKGSLDAVLSEAFQRNESFGNALKEAFEHFINQRQNK